jgi:hypothetical protein
MEAVFGAGSNKLYKSDLPTHLTADDWTLFDKVTYGGLGYGAFSLPSNFFLIIITCLFPPLGQIINTLGTTISSSPPFFNWDCLKVIFQPSSDPNTSSNFTKIIYSFLLTCLFYLPGLSYVLGNIADSENTNKNP